jgi:spore maturation protein CgeB
MVECGYCPSGRLFEAAACGVPALSDRWQGLELFFEPGREVLLADTTEEALEALSTEPAALARMGRAARERTLAQHTAERRAQELLRHLEPHAAPAGRALDQVAAQAGG